MNWKKIESDDATIYESPCKRFRIRSSDEKTWLAGIRINNSESYLYLTADETNTSSKEELIDRIEYSVLIIREFEYVFGVSDMPYSERFTKGLTFIDIPYDERVARGMRLLDHEVSGWESKISIETLDMSISYSGSSILEQASKAVYPALNKSLDVGDMQCRLGVLTEDSQWYGFNNYYDDRSDADSKLSEAWKKAITNRMKTDEDGFSEYHRKRLLKIIAPAMKALDEKLSAENMDNFIDIYSKYCQENNIKMRHCRCTICQGKTDWPVGRHF